MLNFLREPYHDIIAADPLHRAPASPSRSMSTPCPSSNPQLPCYRPWRPVPGTHRPRSPPGLLDTRLHTHTVWPSQVDTTASGGRRTGLTAMAVTATGTIFAPLMSTRLLRPWIRDRLDVVQPMRSLEAEEEPEQALLHDHADEDAHPERHHASRRAPPCRSPPPSPSRRGDLPRP